MLKTTLLAALVGLTTIAATLPSNAAFVAGKPNVPNVPGASVHTDDDCAYQLNYMARVTRATIESIDGQSIYLVPVCEDGLTGANDDYGWLFTGGNVGTLRLPIANNPSLMAALTAQGYDHQDVISLRLGGGDSVMLYVHQRTLR